MARTLAEMNEGQAIAGHAFQAWAMENAALLRASGERLEVVERDVGVETAAGRVDIAHHLHLRIILPALLPV